MRVFFLVLARDKTNVIEKIEELNSLGVPFVIVCGERISHECVVYREAKGKYDAINFGSRLIPRDADIVALNDVDTRVYGVGHALRMFGSKDVGLVFARVLVKQGPQRLFYRILDPIRRRLLINASGELMFVRRKVFENVLPLKPCKAEDSYILFKVLESRHRVVFCKECYVVTDRTKIAEYEEDYKRKVVCGLYQALSYTRPPISIDLFYLLLPFISPILLVTGKNGYFWMKGILLGLADFLRGDRSGVWQTSYMK